MATETVYPWLLTTLPPPQQQPLPLILYRAAAAAAAAQAFTSENWIVRIYKVKDLENRA